MMDINGLLIHEQEGKQDENKKTEGNYGQDDWMQIGNQLNKKWK